MYDSITIKEWTVAQMQLSIIATGGRQHAAGSSVVCQPSGTIASSKMYQGFGAEP